MNEKEVIKKLDEISQMYFKIKKHIYIDEIRVFLYSFEREDTILINNDNINTLVLHDDETYRIDSICFKINSKCYVYKLEDFLKVLNIMRKYNYYYIDFYEDSYRNKVISIM